MTKTIYGYLQQISNQLETHLPSQTELFSSNLFNISMLTFAWLPYQLTTCNMPIEELTPFQAQLTDKIIACWQLSVYFFQGYHRATCTNYITLTYYKHMYNLHTPAQAFCLHSQHPVPDDHPPR